MLDEASENTFLCTDAACVQKFLFDGEVDKVATELKNVVACTSYILEQKLVEAWSADKAAEALRCQKLLVEEEDAAQKRQAEIVERKRMKKLRQKEQRLKDHKDEDTTVPLPEMVDGATSSPGIQSLEAISGPPGLHEQEDPQHLRLSAPMPHSEDNFCSREDVNCGPGQEMDTGAVLREQSVPTINMDIQENLPQCSTVSSSSTIASKHPSSVRHSRHRDPNVGAASNKSKTWAWKVRTDTEERCPKVELAVDANQETAPNTDKNSQVLIGSISVAIEDGGVCSQDYKDHHPAPPESDLNTPGDPVAEAMQPASHDGNGCEDASGGGGTMAPAAEGRSPSSAVTDESGSVSGNAEAAEGVGQLRGTVSSGQEAAAFLSQRWKEALAGDHVKLVLC